MPNTTLQLDNELNNNDLFMMWQNELNLRTSARADTHDASTISISGTQELEFWYRCWYFSDRKLNFFNLLLNNLHNIQVLKWLGDGPVFLLQDFWAFLSWHITINHPQPEKLQFIVNLYDSEYHTAMMQVVNSLNIESCQYLLSRTANPELRKLFKGRETELLKNRKEKLYGFIKSQKNEFPGLYGDKVDNILQTLSLLEEGSVHNFQDPYCAQRFTRLLAAVEGIFRSGMIEDCLGVLIDLYQDYQSKNRLVSLLDDEKIYRTFYRLLRQVIPVYALLNQPLTPYELAARIYTEYFALITPDPASLQYLAVYESIITALNKQNNGILYEIYMKSGILNKCRPFDSRLIESDEINQGIAGWRLEQFMEDINQRISSMPHESFILLEYLGMLGKVKTIDLNDHIAGQLLDHYINLWHWIPCSLFMNENIYSQLAPLAGEGYRYQARAICDVLAENNRDKLTDQISSRPDLFRMKDAWLKRQIFTAHFLGVWK